MKTPILFTLFNRLETAQEVFLQIKAAKPTKLYIAADGPRVNKPGEVDLVNTVRNTIINQIDWKCEVKTLFRDKNLGCKLALSSAISWFFEQEDEGIILEDDCVPVPTFFTFCEKMLETYRHDTRIMLISGTNYLHEQTSEEPDFAYFIRYAAIWGWATWKRAWALYDINMQNWTELKKNHVLYNMFAPAPIASYMERLFDEIAERNADTWDIQWNFSCLFNNGLALVPSKNLIKNIGIVGTHTDGKSPTKPTADLTSVDHIRLPLRVFPDYQKELTLYRSIGATQILPHIKLKTKQLLYQLLKRRP